MSKTSSSSSVKPFIDGIEPDQRREDARTLLHLMTEVTGEAAVLRGSIVGFGTYHYRYESGREGDSALVAFSPRKQNLVVYIMPGFSDYAGQLDRLGKFKTGKSCLYINKLADIDLSVLRELVSDSIAVMRQRYH